MPQGSGADTDRRSDACVVTSKLVNTCRPWLGAAATDYTQVPSDVRSQTEYHERRIGRALDIVHDYHPIGSDHLSPDDVYFATRPHTMLFTNWKPAAKWSDVSANNAGIDQMAASVKSLGDHKIFMTLWHEAEAAVSPGGDANCPNVAYKGSAGTVVDYRNMWRYVEDRFAADGVTNVVWVMNYMNFDRWDCLIPDLYPGNDLIDWVVFNAYPPPPTNGVTQSFATTVGRFTGLLSADTDATHAFTSKPWGIVEWAAGGRSRWDQIAYYFSAKFTVDANLFPNIKMYMIYDSNAGTVPVGLDDRVAYDDDHSFDPLKAAAYSAFADDPNFRDIR